MTDQPAIDQRPTHTTPDSPREELAALLASWMKQASEDAYAEAGHTLGYRELADALVEHAMRVEDEWDSVDLSNFGDGPGTNVTHQRYLTVRIPRQVIRSYRITDRSVG